MMETSDSLVHVTRRITLMKKIMSIMLGLSLVLGAATVAFGQDKTDTTKKTKKKKKKADTTK
jgi:hypothetical protein